jgi:hypothetical protein
MVRVQVVTDQLVNLGAQRRRRVASSERRHGNTKLLERDGIARVIGQPLAPQDVEANAHCLERLVHFALGVQIAREAEHAPHRAARVGKEDRRARVVELDVEPVRFKVWYQLAPRPISLWVQ